MKNLEILAKIIQSTSTKFQNERQLNILMTEILNIHADIMVSGKVNRKLKRRIRKAWKIGLPFDLYQRLGLYKALEARHIELIIKG